MAQSLAHPLTRDPDPRSHQFHRTGFSSTDMEEAMSSLVEHLAEMFTARRETWTDTLIVIGFVDIPHDGHRDSRTKATALMGNHAGAWPIGWNFGSDVFSALLDTITAQREVDGDDWNILAVRLSRANANLDTPVHTQLRGFPMSDPVGFLTDDQALLPLLGGIFPYEQ